MQTAVFSTNGRGTNLHKMENHAPTRRAADLIDRALKQNDYRDTTCALQAVCEYNTLSHPHHCCQITSNPGRTLAKGLATTSRETTRFTEAPPSRRLPKTAAAARIALPTTFPLSHTLKNLPSRFRGPHPTFEPFLFNFKMAELEPPFFFNFQQLLAPGVIF